MSSALQRYVSVKQEEDGTKSKSAGPQNIDETLLYTMA
jgi:hypothetical protein